MNREERVGRDNPADNLPAGGVRKVPVVGETRHAAPSGWQGDWGGRGLILLASLMWSTSGMFAQAPVFQQWSLAERGMLLAFWRAVFAAAVLVPLLIPLARRPGRSWWDPRLIPAGIFFAVMNLTFLKAMTLTTAANAIWLQYTAPAWVILVGVNVLRERAILRDWVMVGSAMLGVTLIVFFEWHSGLEQAQNRAGVVWALVAGATLAGVMLSLRSLKELPVVWTTFVCHFSAAVILAPLVLFDHRLPSGRLLGWMAVFGSVQLAIPYLCFARGLRTTSSHEAACIALLEPLLVPFWVFVCWRHSPDYRGPAWWTWLGGGIICLGLVARYAPVLLRRHSRAEARHESQG